MQGFCDLWEGDLKRAKQSDSDNVKLQQEVYDLVESNESLRKHIRILEREKATLKQQAEEMQKKLEATEERRAAVEEKLTKGAITTVEHVVGVIKSHQPDFDPSLILQAFVEKLDFSVDDDDDEDGIGCSEEHAAELARARYEEKKLDEHRSRVSRTVQSPIVLSDEGNEDEDDTGRLSALIALAEASLQAQEGKDDTGRLN
ncbi:uncharacterized protein [Miscanthus floridulus]|uniref:uncharacterized protein n=1 Tax=Miscanthus floridulus TaxID=154761 RepID=UPI0034597E4F